MNIRTFLACAALIGSPALDSLVAQQPKPAAPKPVTPVEKKAPAPPAGAPKPKAEPAPAKPKTYVVRSGDNPWKIARAHGVALDELMKVNRIEDAKGLKIGDELIIPTSGSSTARPETKPAAKPEARGKAAPDAAPAPKDGDDWIWYTIKKGENPWSISKKLKVDHQKVMSLNEGVDFRDLKIGQKIKVPRN